MSVHISDLDGIRTVTIDRPERRNALDPATMSRIGESFLAAAADDEVRVLILTGAGDQSFCSGMDLKAFRDSSAPAVAPGRGTDVFAERFYPKPIIAAVNGAAVGGGFGLVLACDIVVAAQHAVFALPEVQRGLVGAGAVSRAAMRLGPAIAAELALTGDPIDAGRAHQLGIVNRVVPREDLMDTARKIAGRIAANGPLSVRVTKEIIDEVRHLSDGIDMPSLRAKAAPVMNSADAREGAAAFAEKRVPRFTGR
jgi:enoyl-CoA hydratase